MPTTRPCSRRGRASATAAASSGAERSSRQSGALATAVSKWFFGLESLGGAMSGAHLRPEPSGFASA